MRNAALSIITALIVLTGQSVFAGECVIAWPDSWSKQEVATLQDCKTEVAIVAKSLCEDFSETMGLTDLSYTFAGEKYSVGSTSFECQ